MERCHAEGASPEVLLQETPKQRRPGQPIAEWVNVFEIAVLDMKAERLNVELKSMGWLLFAKKTI